MQVFARHELARQVPHTNPTRKREASRASDTNPTRQREASRASDHMSPTRQRGLLSLLSPVPCPPSQPLLLLEGSWPAAATDGPRWSLDDSIDQRMEWIDAAAVELAARAGRSSGEAAPLSGTLSTLADLHSLALRYYLARLLRVIAFFDEVHRPATGEAVDLYLTCGADEDYHDLFSELAHRHGWHLSIHWHEPAASPSKSARRQSRWRRWAAAAADRLTPRPPRVPLLACPAVSSADQAPRVMLCGSPRVLDPICAELVARGCQVWWLYEQFAVRCWWRWRRAGVRQLICAPSTPATFPSDEALPRGLLTYRHIDLTVPIERWIRRRATHFPAASWPSSPHPPIPLVPAASWPPSSSSLQPPASSLFLQSPASSLFLILDEDCTPLKRAAIALARSHGIRSVVVQHGAPCVRFGFAPLYADLFCAWGESSRRQLGAWQVPSHRIVVTGRSQESEVRGQRSERRQESSRLIAPSPHRLILLLATVQPADNRPDSVAFHLTRRTHEQMLEIAFAAVARLPRAQLLIKLHPRCVDDSDFRSTMARFPTLDTRLVRHADLPGLVDQADCVLSCASTAGIEAAWAGAPVIQLLPAGSADVLPAQQWGLLGSAREQHELEALLDAALSGAAAPVPPSPEPVFAATGRAAAQRIVDLLLSRNRPETGGRRPRGQPTPLPFSSLQPAPAL